MSETPERPVSGALTERRVAEELGVERMEVYLLAAKYGAGHFDSLTHLLTFTDKEVDELAARLGIERRKRSGPSEGDLQVIPEPGSE